MKSTYENFSELAAEMVKGDGILHHGNCAQKAIDYFKENADKYEKNPCFAWMKGVEDFAGWLDHIGVEISVTDSAEDFYEYKRKVSL